MQLLRLAEVPTHNRDTIYAYSRTTAVATFVSLLSIVAAVVAFSATRGIWIGYFVGAFWLLLLLLFQKSVAARFRPSNWLVRATDNGLFIKFRSYLNCHFPAQDYTVVFIPYAEMRSAKRVNELRQITDRDESPHPTNTTRKIPWLELELAGDTRQLAIAMANEKDTVLAKSRSGAEKPSTRYQHFPVRLPAPTTLRMEWAVRPKLDSILTQLSRHTLVQPTEACAKDFTNLPTLSQNEQETRLLELAESGDLFTAITLARKLYGYDLTQAKAFIDELIGKKALHP